MDRTRPSVRNYSLDLTRHRKLTDAKAVSPSSCSVKFMPEVLDNQGNTSARKHSSLSQPALRCHSRQHHNILSPHALAVSFLLIGVFGKGEIVNAEIFTKK
ncbi:hypothetical protein GCK72_008886 [Caenorhabditis remanei]|uniref:Uncharacterized protein n=1 Tax=Caenorhabditis remanei TaxID=31234 RepID=A0A6A5GZY1_CAERE|nr:hypothetical protein GCK72_008886 [Caenorhabditis remanei]KAF1760637.1 hypothetical protein GCK72_008886 [Caenorhabditis remanei]